jgi:hypothetical protein
MAVYHGSGGALSLAGTNVAQVTEWTVTQNKEMVEVTALGDGVRAYTSGLESFEGSAEIIIASDDVTGAFSQTVGTEYAAIFFMNDVTTAVQDIQLSGQVIISSIEFTQTFDDVARASISFQGTKKSDGTGLTVDLSSSS